MAALIGASAKELVWTSGATESNNLAIKGAAQFYRQKGRHLVTVATEHKAVLDSMHALERDGWTRHRPAGRRATAASTRRR